MSSIAEIRSWFEVPAIAHYCYLFRAAFDLTEFEIEDLEDSLLIDGAAEGEETSFLPDLLARLLRGLYRTKDINGKNYSKYLSDLLDYHYTYLNGKESPVKDADFRTLPCRTKVTILYDICHWRLEVDDIQELLKGKEADELRIEPIGYNSKGDTFWYFYGTRLYKESLADKDSAMGNGDCSGTFSKKRGKGRPKKQKKRDHSWIDSSSDYETGSDWDQQDSHASTLTDTSQWSLQCSTEEEWNLLADSLRGSKDTNDRALLSVLSDKFLDSIPELIEAKEKALRKKLLVEAIPRRASGRIALKLLQKEEEERILEEQETLKEQEKARELEERRKEMEERKKHEREIRLKERERVAEERRIEREKRLKHREEQKWALENPELAWQVGITLRNGEIDGDNGEKQQSELKDSDSYLEKDEDEYTAMYKVIAAVKRHKDVWPFLEPVEESCAPQYYDIIENPMDISTMEKKLDNSSYANRDDMTADFKLIVSNCHSYNGPDSPYTKMANNLERAYNKHFAKEFPEEVIVSDEDYDVDEDDSFSSRKRGKSRLNEKSSAKKSKMGCGNPKSDDSPGNDRQYQSPGASLHANPTPNLYPINPFPPQNILRYGNLAYAGNVLRASMLQSQLRGTGIYQLLNAANPTSSSGSSQPTIAPQRLPFPGRPDMRASIPPSSPQFANLMNRTPTASTGPATTQVQSPPNQNPMTAVLNQQAIIRGLLARGNANAARQVAQFTPEQLQMLQRMSILRQQGFQQRLQMQHQQQQSVGRQLQHQQLSNLQQISNQQQQQQQNSLKQQQQLQQARVIQQQQGILQQQQNLGQLHQQQPSMEHQLQHEQQSNVQQQHLQSRSKQQQQPEEYAVQLQLLMQQQQQQNGKLQEQQVGSNIMQQQQQKQSSSQEEQQQHSKQQQLPAEYPLQLQLLMQQQQQQNGKLQEQQVGSNIMQQQQQEQSSSQQQQQQHSKLQQQLQQHLKIQQDREPSALQQQHMKQQTIAQKQQPQQQLQQPQQQLQQPQQQLQQPQQQLQQPQQQLQQPQQQQLQQQLQPQPPQMEQRLQTHPNEDHEKKAKKIGEHEDSRELFHKHPKPTSCQQQQEQFSLQLQQHLKLQHELKQKQSPAAIVSAAAPPPQPPPAASSGQPCNQDEKGKPDKPEVDISSKKIEELHAIIEDPLSEENRNKRISVEESNQRVRKWLNANTPFFGRQEDDIELNETKHVNKKEHNLGDSAKILNVKTEIIEEGDNSKRSVPRTVGTVNYSLPRHGLVASLPHGATFVPGFMQTGSRNHSGQQAAHEIPTVATIANTQTLNPVVQSNVSKSSFHIENLVSTSSLDLSATKNVNVNSVQLASVTVGKHVSPNQIHSQNVITLQEKDQLSTSNLEKRNEARFINAIPTSLHQKETRKIPVSATGISPLRISPSVSLFGSMGMLHTSKQGTSIATKSRRTPTHVSPSSHGSSMSPQASSVRTNLSSSRTEQPRSQNASPQNLPSSNEIYQKVSKFGSNFPPYGMEFSRPPLSMSMPLSNLLRPSDAARRLHPQQQPQHNLAEAIRSRYVENERLAALNAFRPPHMDATSSSFKQDQQGS